MDIARKELVRHIKITLPLVALCLPLSAQYYVKEQNACPYETYIRVEGKCIDISEEGLSDIAKELDTPNVKEVNQEIREVNQELIELGEEVAELCLEEQPETLAQVEILEDICQY